MTTSVNTNQAALIALQNLNATSSSLAATQQRISTGLKVSSAKDNAAIFQIAQGQRAQVSSLDAVKDSLQRGQSVLDTAQAAGGSISDLLVQMKAKALAASDPGISADARTALSNEYNALYNQIDTVSANAAFDGTNLIAAAGGANGTDNIKALANAQGSATIDIAHQDLSTGGINTALAAETPAVAAIPASFAAAAPTQAQLASIDSAIQAVTSSLATLGTGSKQLDTHLTFVTKLQDSLTTGIGNLVDADVAKESANLTALQTKQQLGVQALSIANSAPQIILSLFKG